MDGGSNCGSSSAMDNGTSTMGNGTSQSTMDNGTSQSTMECNAVDETQSRTRKRKRDPKSWERNTKKQRRNSGKAYVSTSGKAVPPRRPGRDCRCSLRCFERVPEAERNRILTEFYELGSFDIQNAYLHGLVRAYQPKRRYTDRGTTSRRQMSYSYYVHSQTADIKVCLTAFCSIHDISKKRVANIRRNPCTPPLDRRGKHASRPNRTPVNAVATVRMHIQSFPKQMSHYSRKENPNRCYLSPELNITKMHQLYQQRCDENGWPNVSEPTYRRIFCETFNLAFGSPRTDTCKTCDMFKAKLAGAVTESEKAELAEQHDQHLQVAENAYKRLREDSQLSQAQPINYQVYNFGIHNCGTGDSCMCMWPESIAKRGSDEVASCLLQYFSSLVSRPPHLIAYSDSCAGQNKNFYILCFWVFVVMHELYEMVDHKFLVSGHTFLPSDRDFALIEKKKREREVFVPEQWYRLVEETRSRSPFRVARIQQENIKSFKSFSTLFVNRKKTRTGEKVAFQKIAWFRISKGNPTDIFKYSLAEDEEWKIMSLARRGAQPKPPITLTEKYSEPIMIDEKKLADLQKIIPFIPKAYHTFYNSLNSQPHTGESDAEYIDSDVDD